MDTLAAIRTFRQVVESGSFVAAAKRLDVSTAMVSKRVQHLEQRLRVRLLNRNNRNLSLTEPGRVYFERCKTILDELQATELELGCLVGAPRGTLRITAPSFAGQLLADLLAQYRSRYPDVLVDASFEDRCVDLVAEGYDLALRIASNPSSLPPDLIARPAQSATFYLAASPHYLERYGPLNVPADLSRHSFVAAGNGDCLSLCGSDGNIDIPLQVVLRCRSMGAVANAVAAGIGIGIVPSLVLEASPFTETLTPILAEYPFQRALLYVVYVSRQFVTPKVRTFADFIVGSLSPNRESSGPWSILEHLSYRRRRRVLKPVREPYVNRAS
jgi:DNA-binding transcriptional LysR family regulator